MGQNDRTSYDARKVLLYNELCAMRAARVARQPEEAFDVSGNLLLASQRKAPDQVVGLHRPEPGHEISGRVVERAVTGIECIQKSCRSWRKADTD